MPDPVSDDDFERPVVINTLSKGSEFVLDTGCGSRLGSMPARDFVLDREKPFAEDLEESRPGFIRDVDAVFDDIDR